MFSVFHTTILCQSVMSFHSPVCESFVRRPVARENFETEIPLGVNFVSASLPRFPTRMTLLTLRAIIPCTVTQEVAKRLPHGRLILVFHLCPFPAANY